MLASVSRSPKTMFICCDRYKTAQDFLCASDLSRDAVSDGEPPTSDTYMEEPREITTE